MSYFAKLNEDLSEFTGIPLEIVGQMVARKRFKTHTQCFEFFKPETPEELKWFYKSNNAYLFSNAKHKPWKPVRNIFNELNDKLGGSAIRTLDFGCGLATTSFELFNMTKNNNRLWASVVDVNIIQLEFIRWRILKYGINELFVYESLDEMTINNSYSLFNMFDIVYAEDVFEHIWDYKDILMKLLKFVKSGGYFVEHSPFSRLSGIQIHLKDEHSMPAIIESFGFKKIDNGIWEKT